MRKDLGRCERNAAAKRQVADARERLEKGKWAEALALVNSIGRDSPYADEAEAIRARAKLVEAGQLARIEYNGGQGEKALRILEKAGLSKTSQYVLIKRVLDNTAAAQRALEAGEFDKAQASWQAVVEIEGSARNSYRQDARKNIAAISENKKSFAEQIALKGREAYDQGRFKEARRAFGSAKRLDSENLTAHKGILAMKRAANRDYNNAMRFRRTDPKEAIRLLRRVKARLLPGETYYTRANKMLEELGAEQ